MKRQYTKFSFEMTKHNITTVVVDFLLTYPGSTTTDIQKEIAKRWNLHRVEVNRSGVKFAIKRSKLVKKVLNSKCFVNFGSEHCHEWYFVRQ